MVHVVCRWLGLLGLFLLAQVAARAQGAVGYGDWQLHLPANRPLRLADAGSRLYVATENAFYFLDKTQNTTQVLTRRDGLSDVGVADVAYDSVTQQTVVAYRSSNIDVLQPNGGVRNLSDILRKPIQGRRDINRVSIGAGKAYLSTSFGLVSIDLAKLEISDTYSNIGPGGAAVTVFDAAVANGFLYVASSAGLLRGQLTRNLLDYRNWTQYLPVPLPAAPQQIYRLLTPVAGRVYAAVDGSGVWQFVEGNPGTWRLVAGSYSGQFRSLRTAGSSVLVPDDQFGVRRIDRNNVVSSLIPPPPGGDLTLDVVRSVADASYYVANYGVGLQRVRPGTGQANERFVPNGPETSLAFGLVADARSNVVDVFSGGFSERYFPLGYRAGFYEYAGGQWTNFTRTVLPSATDFPNPINPSRGVRTPDGTLYVASFGGGLLEWKGPGNFRQFTSTASGIPGSPILPFAFAGNDRIADVAADPTGNVWLTNPHGAPNRSGLFQFAPATGTWTTVPYSPNFENLDRLALDDAGLVWASVARKANNPAGIPNQVEGGVYAIDPAQGTANAPRYFSVGSGLPDNQVYELVKDRRGYIWAATIKGVAVFNDANGPFVSGTTFTLPYVRRGEGSGFPALFTEAVRCMAVDGGDRKWFGTDNGLWLFSPDADEALLHFTKWDPLESTCRHASLSIL